MRNNIILLTDGYKCTHWKQYPPDTQKIYSYFEAREPVNDFPNVVFFGLQYYLMKYLEGQVVTQEKIDAAEKRLKNYFQNPELFNRKGWEYILEKHEGRLPVVIKAVPEGTVVPRSNVMMTIENTDPNCYWLTNYLETLLVQVWYPCTVATVSREIKMVIMNYLDKSGDPDKVDFMLHDFGFRGVSSVESSAIGDAAHLINFKGTDTLSGLDFIEEYYGFDSAGYSIPASEHSTMTSWGQDKETEAYDNMLKQYPTGLVSVVSDSWDIRNACQNIWGKTLKSQVLAREGTVVIRPDSGNPVTSVINTLNYLGQAFGMDKNEKGYWVLNNKVRILQGDGIDLKVIEDTYKSMDRGKWSADNVAFGSGGGLLQKINRDTLRFAFKCASITAGGAERDVFKNPTTDKTKASKAGRMKLVYCEESKQYITVKEKESGEDVLQEVFRDGKILRTENFEDIRARAFVD